MPSDPQRDEMSAALWRTLVNRESDFYTARHGFMTGVADRVPVLRAALATVADRGTALRLIPILPLGEREALFDDLVRVAPGDSAARRRAGRQRQTHQSVGRDRARQRLRRGGVRRQLHVLRRNARRHEPGKAEQRNAERAPEMNFHCFRLLGDEPLLQAGPRGASTLKGSVTAAPEP